MARVFVEASLAFGSSPMGWEEEWAARDGLDPRAFVKTAINVTSGSYLLQWGKGPELGLVSRVLDGPKVDHDWPATIDNSDNLSHKSGPAGFNASAIIMNFFAKYVLP